MQKNESLSTKNVTHRITKRWVAEDDGNDIADIEVSVTTLRGFQEINTGELLENIAEGFRAFYLEVGNALNAEQAPDTDDANKKPTPEAGTPVSEREQLIRQLEHRLAKLKSGASPAEIILNNREETAHEHKEREKVTLGPGAHETENVGMKIILKGSKEEIAGILGAAAEEIAALVLAAQERQSENQLDKLARDFHDVLNRRAEDRQSRRELK